MRSPFPGMDPYLEHPALWPDVHNSLITAIRDVLAPQLAPDYYVGIERRAYLLKPDDVVFVGRPDIAVIPRQPVAPRQLLPLAETGVVDVELAMGDEISENFLEIHEVTTGKLVTILELLSPVNKLHGKGRQEYEEKRDYVLHSRTNLVEADLLRAGEPMALGGRPIQSDYRILVSRSWQRPRAQLYFFNLRQPIPSFALPLQQGEVEPFLDLGATFHALYGRARFDLRLDYSQPPVHPLSPEDITWAKELLNASSSTPQ
jgi:hypothetical protein